MLTEEQIQRYNQDGYLVLKDFITLDECEKLREAIYRIVDAWEPERDSPWLFSNVENKIHLNHQYLVDSSDKVCCFTEDDAINPETGKFNQDKRYSVRRIGHNLHTLEPEFKRVAYSDKVKAVLRDLNFVQPAIRQTLATLKQPFIGTEVPPHQDGTFVYNDPLNVINIWIALEDATLENGCLWFIPGSNSKPIKSRFIHNPDEKEFNEGRMFVMVGKDDSYDHAEFVPVEVKAGDCVLLHGQVVHKSEKNTSPISRHVYSITIMETHNSAYSKENWLQLETPFPVIYDN
jgi:ectoine hydroxylase-related dioxygenase (phytanoyl-CoA dioxygenase family)